MASSDRATPGGFRSTVWGEAMAEVFGTFILIVLGDGVVAMAVAALNQSGRGDLIFAASGDWLLIAWGWAFAVTFGVYAAGGVSGAHLNPAVTLAFAVKRGFSWAKVPIYMVSQLVGAFLGAALVFAVYRDAIGSYEQAHNITRGDPNSLPTFSIFATFPAPYFHSWVGPFVDQIVGTALLVGLILAVVDELNTPVRSNLAPLVIGFVVAAIGISYGANAGYAINPARDFGPRVLAWMAGWGDVALPGKVPHFSAYFWIPIVGPFIGAVIGAILYDLFIHDVLVARGEQPPPDIEQRGRVVEEVD